MSENSNTMASGSYLIENQHAPHFLTFTIVEWIDLFTRPIYRYEVVDSLNYCVKHKGLHIYAWCLMSNHIHLVCKSDSPFKLSQFVCDFKKFTNKRMVALMRSPKESRCIWLLDHFHSATFGIAKVKDYHVWQDGYHGIELDSNYLINQKIEYTHQNPVKAEIVSCPEDYLYSSAQDYNGVKGLVDVEVI